MGSCGSSKETIVVNRPPMKVSKRNSNKTSNANDIDGLREFENIDPKFRNMPEWEGDRYRGEGVKRMKGYKCNLKIDLLYQLREDFWVMKMKEKLVWRNLKQACIMDDVRADQIIKQLGLKTVSGCLDHLVDENGNHYFIPNFCINDPYFEKEFGLDENVTEFNHENEKIVKIYINDLYENKKTQLEISLNATGQDLKHLYFSKNKFNESTHKIRLLFGGAEILDEHRLFQHHLKNEFNIQLLKRLYD